VTRDGIGSVQHEDASGRIQQSKTFTRREPIMLVNAFAQVVQQRNRASTARSHIQAGLDFGSRAIVGVFDPLLIERIIQKPFRVI
jgi:hypothetical protein